MRNSIEKMIVAVLLAGSLVLGADDLDKGFQTPPDAAKPHTYWFWMNGNITREGITADLEAMAHAGIGGALIFSHLPHSGIPFGPVRYNSPEWYALIKHAAAEARRLGLELGIHNGAGWMGSSGPWTKPEHGMQMVASSEVRVKGPVRFEGVLPQPKANLNFYRDIAVFAFPTPPQEAVLMADCPPKVTVSTEPPAAAGDKAATLRSQTFLFEFPRPFMARTLTFSATVAKLYEGRLEISDDGQAFRIAKKLSIQASFNLMDPGPVFTFPPVTARFFRLTLEHPNGIAPLPASAIELSPRLGIERFTDKAFLMRREVVATAAGGEDAGIPSGKLVELTGRMGPDGRLAWDVPAGDWTLLRLGHTANGKMGFPATKGALGLECDKLSAEAMDAHWAGMLNPLLDQLGPLAGPGAGGLKSVHIDSYEAGTQNWTADFRQQFQKRRGYDPGPYLPVLAGHVIGSTAISDRFLWDLRRTVSDLFHENYSGRFATLAHDRGLRFSLEPYDQAPACDLEYGAPADLPMGEFWHGGELFIWSCKIASSVGHIHGRKIIGAEAFTSVNKYADPYALKSTGDRAFCLGINRLVFHRYAHQPWVNVKPGMMFGAYGTQLDRTVTWWEQGRAWINYLTRCQYLLQQGLFAADVCFYVGESVPMRLGKAAVPDGYNYDGCDTPTLNRFTVRDGRLTLPDGMSYRLLVLPEDRAMSPAVLRKIGELAAAGATIIGRKPELAQGLAGYPQADAEVRRLADEIWARGVKDQPLATALKALGIEPDFQAKTTPSARLLHIHRTLPGAEVYFISNQLAQPVEAEAIFRVSGLRPELWHPDTGRIESATIYAPQGKGTSVRLHLDPCGSVFVVFRSPADASHLANIRFTPATATPVPDLPGYELLGKPNQPVLRVWQAGRFEMLTASGQTRRLDVPAVPAPVAIGGPWVVNFPPKLGAPAQITLDRLISWTEHADPGVKYFSGTASYRTTFHYQPPSSASRTAYFLDLGEVKNIAEMRLNGQDLGILWKPPFRLDVTGLLKAGRNELEVRITNPWTNRLIGDEFLPEDWEPKNRPTAWPRWLSEGKPSPTGRITFITTRLFQRSDPLLASGLLGPVMLRPVCEYDMDVKK